MIKLSLIIDFLLMVLGLGKPFINCILEIIEKVRYWISV